MPDGSDTSWWDRLITTISGTPLPPLPAKPTPPKVDETAWAKSVERARISNQMRVHDLGLIVFNETQSFTDRPDSNEPIDIARQKLAQAVINADQKWGAERKKWSNTAGAIEPSDNALRNATVRRAYESSMKAAREAYLSGTDPTNGAVYLNQRETASRANRVMSKLKPQAVPLSTQSGPYDNLYPGREVRSSIVWLNTYKHE